MAHFKANPANKGKVMDKGFWRYTRHPNYFGDATVWWAFGLFSVAAGSYLPFIGSLLMTLLLLKVSGVSLLERTLKETKPQYSVYIKKTSSFLPWFPKK
jgi:steroid 5-alpha reductase family enzyme